MKRKEQKKQTRKLLFDTALHLFRTQGFKDTTMRDIAKKAKMSLGSTYHHFDSKQAIVFAYYAHHQDKHETLVTEKMEALTGLKERLSFMLHSKIDLLNKDQNLFQGLVGNIVDPTDPLSAFSEETQQTRQSSLCLWKLVLTHPSIPKTHVDILTMAFWALQMGTLLYFVADKSPKLEKTHALIDGAIQSVEPVLMLLQTPFAAPALKQIKQTLAQAGLFERSSENQPSSSTD